MPHFITDKCQGCMRCNRKCPVDAISGNLHERHIINPDLCMDCGVCGRFCRENAILDENSNQVFHVPVAQRKIPEFDTSQCTACSLCVSICTKDAIAISMPTYKGDHNVFAQLANRFLCVGCEMCADICPMNAITMKVQGELK